MIYYGTTFSIEYYGLLVHSSDGIDRAVVAYVCFYSRSNTFITMKKVYVAMVKFHVVNPSCTFCKVIFNKHT